MDVAEASAEDKHRRESENDAEDFPGRLLHQAALWENAELLEDLLNGDQIEHIDVVDVWGRTALHASVANESSVCTRILLQAGAEANIPCSTRHDHQTPLHVAAKQGRAENVKLLLEWKADLLAKDSKGLTALDLAEQGGHQECMQVLIAAADERERFREEAHQFLREACAKADVARAKTIVKELDKETEVVVNAAPTGNCTLLFRACEDGHKDVVKLLLENGADGRIHPVTRYSPLYVACYNGRKDIVEILLKKFPELSQVSTVERWLPIHAAAINGHLAVLDLLLKFPYPSHMQKVFRDKTGVWEFQLPFDVNAQDVTGQTVLCQACYLGNQKLVELLLKHRVRAGRVSVREVEALGAQGAQGHEANAADVTNSNALANGDEASPRRRLSDGIQSLMSKLNLTKNGSDGNSQQQCPLKPNESFISPLHIDVYCSNGTETALHVAVRNKHLAIAALLLQSNADPNLKMHVLHDDSILAGHASSSNYSSQASEDDCIFAGSTALVEACRNRDTAMIDLLLRHGARDDDCKALTIAARTRDESVVARLLALKSHPDPEFKINKKAMDKVPVNQLGALAFAGVGGVTYSAMFPTMATMVNWHGQKCLDAIKEHWLVEAGLACNPKLRATPKNHQMALYAITRLDVSNNALVELPECVFRLPSLRCLNAAQNKIEKLPPAKGTLSLHISPTKTGPRVTGSPERETADEVGAVYDCPFLEEIHLQDNRLDAVPTALFGLTALLVLDLSNNKLQSLPFQMWTAPKLREMNVSFNLLKDLPVRYRRHYTDSNASNPSTSPSTWTNAPVGPTVTSNDDLAAGSSSPRRSGDSTPGNGSRSSKTSLPEREPEDGKIDAEPAKAPGSPEHGGICSDLRSRELQHHNMWSWNVEINESIMDDEESSKDNQSQLTTLNLAHNAFETVPAGLACLAVNLTRLNLSYNRLTEMGPVGAYPMGLKHLDLSHNQLRCWFSPRILEAEPPLDMQGFFTCCNANESSPRHANRPCVVPLRKLARGPYSSSSTSLNSLASPLCSHRRHNRLDNLRTIILANNELDRLMINWDEDVSMMTSDDDESRDSVEVSSRSQSQKDTVHSSSPVPSLKSRLLFPNLSMLDVSNNRLHEVPISVHELSNLSVLNISGNTEITQLPPQIGILSKLWNLNTRGCNLSEPLKTMIDSKKYKTMDVVGYLKSILEDARMYSRMKLMIVGVQGIGKTSLLEQLRQEGTGSYRKKPSEHWAKRMGSKNTNLKTPKGVSISTVGVDICDWTYEKKIRGHSSHGAVTFRTWDFGGQREYYATHQYFLSKRSLYLVVWKITDGEKGVAGIQQWLVNIQARAPNSPVLIVGTHYDLIRERFPPTFSEDLQQMIRDRFMNVIDADKCGLPRVLDTIEISCRTRHNVKLLCNLIYDTVFELRSPGSKERLLEQRIPATYLALEDVVSYLAIERRLQGKDPVLQTEQYRMLVVHEMQQRFRLVFRDIAELNQATTFLHENGVLLHYEDATLKDLYFLDPQWLCDMLAHVVTVREINPFARNGIMKMDDLKLVFKSSICAPSDAEQYIVNLLNKFEVALTWDSRTLLIPSLLPSEEQMRIGLPGCDVRIPVRSRGWAMRSKATPILNRAHAAQPSSSPRKDEPHEDVLPTSSDQPILAPVEDCHIVHRVDPHASIRRLLLMSYFPSGFWSRLLTRMLADDTVVDIVRSYFALPNEVRQDPALWSVLDKKAEWVCWQTGIELRYAHTTIFRMKEILPELSNAPCDYHRMRFMLQQEGTWAELDISMFAILEIILTNQTLVLKRPFVPSPTSANICQEKDDILYQSIILDPNPECVTKLLALAVDHIDTLLEDWYPTLGTRFVHTSEGKFLVTRVVPCTPCLVSQFRADGNAPSRHAHLVGDGDLWHLVEGGGTQGEPRFGKSVSLLPPGNPPADALPHRNPGSQDSTVSLDSDSGVDPDSSCSSRKLSAEGHWDCADAPLNQGQVTDGGLQVVNAVVDSLVYCFMVEECILTAYEEKCMRCPVHGGIPLAQIAPDAVFLDLGERYLIRPDAIRKGKMLGRGAFGFVFRASVKQRASNMSIDVAMKMLQPVDPGYGARPSATAAFKAAQSKWQRDPIQYACKAYCTARQELGILLTLRHPYIVPLVGMSTRPLALVLELAPQCALDTVLKNYRRSGARLNVYVLQKIVIQVGKALEYIHQQHIIYRDLKSENVLVWQMPPPFSPIPYPVAAVEVKLADYGISRSTLPAGTKGFGGTEGFMAPEIMKYNGEEEYTEKVDCFSFGMFMYELLTLHLPFEGHESVKDYILEGGRPSLSQRETLYPMYTLDLMALCWAQQPKDRPSASQIVSIASAPEFAHLMDTVSLEDHMTALSAGAVESQEETVMDTLWTSSAQAEIWLSRLGQQMDVLSCNRHKWQDYKTFTLDSGTITQVCVVEGTAWLGDSRGNIRIYSVSRCVELYVFALEPHTTNSIAVRSMCYLPQVKLVAMSLSSGRLWICRVGNLCRDSPFTLSRDELEESLIELGSNGIPVHSMAQVYVASKGACELWCGQSRGTMSLFTLREEGLVTGQDVLAHGDAVAENLDVLLVVTSEEDYESLWSYMYPGCVVYHWDVSSRSIINKLDCSKLAPCSESLKSINIEEHLSPGRCQVTAMATLGDELYIGTTWGCLIVAEGSTMLPVTVFRPFEDEVKAIVPILRTQRTTPNSGQDGKDVESKRQQLLSPVASPTREILTGRGENEPVVATIGKGYRNLIGRYTNLPISQRHDVTSAKKNVFALLWRSGYWSSP